MLLHHLFRANLRLFNTSTSLRLTVPDLLTVSQTRNLLFYNCKMWEQGLNYDQGGGFYGGDNQGGQNTPSTGEKRRQRAQNLVPVKIGEILDNREETFKVEGMEVGMVAIVGIVDTVDHQVNVYSSSVQITFN